MTHADLHLHDTYYVVRSFSFVPVVTAILGVIIIIFSKPLARLICKGVDEEKT